MNWRDKLDPFLRTHLESQLRETMKYREDYKFSRDPSKAQLWIAIANLSRQLFNVTVKMNYMEKLVQEKFAEEKYGVPSTILKAKPKKTTNKAKKVVKRKKKR